MHIKIHLSVFLILQSIICFSRNDKTVANNNWQNALNNLNTYTKQHYNQTFEVKNGMILKHPKAGKSEFKIKDYYNILKFPQFKSVFVARKNESECVYAYYKYKQNDNLAFGIQCDTEKEMDTVFILLSNFWQALTGVESKMKYTNAQLTRIQYIENRKITIVSFPGNEPYKKNLKKHAKDSVYTIGLFLNNDMETYRGYLDMDGNLCHVDKLKIGSVINDSTSTKSIVQKTSPNNTITQTSKRDEAVAEMKKLAETVKEYNQSMKMYQKDCEKDKEFHQQVSYGRSTPCDNIITYNKLIKSAIESYLEKYQNHITAEDVRYLKEQISQAETNMENAKLK